MIRDLEFLAYVAGTFALASVGMHWTVLKQWWAAR